MITTAHEKIREDLKALADGELRLPRRALLTRHVATCLECQKEMEEMKKITHNLFVSEGPSTLSDPLRTRLLGSIGDAVDVSGNRPQPIWQRRSSWIYGSTGAVAVASAVVFGTTYMSAMHEDSGSKPAGMPDAPVAGSSIERTGTQALPHAAFRVDIPYERRAMAVAAASAEAKVPAMHARIRGSAIAQAASPASDASVVQTAPGAPAAAAAVQGSAGPSGVFRPGNIVSATVSSMSPKPIPLPGRGEYAKSTGAGTYVGGNVRDVDNQAELGVEVDDVEAAGEKIGDMVKSDGGYVATNKLMIEENVRVDYLTVKVPAKDFDSMIAGFARFGTVVSKNVSGEDITDKTGDANSDEQAQIDQVTETEQKLQAERMGDRRRSALEEQLTEQRSELAQTRSRLGTLRKTAAMSTVNLTLTERAKKAAPVEPKSTFWSGVGETNHAATVAFQSAIRVPLVLGIWLVALSPIWGPLVLLFRYLARKQAAVDQRER